MERATQDNVKTRPQTAPTGTGNARSTVSSEMQKAAEAIMRELKKVIVGKDDVIRKVLMVICLLYTSRCV